MIPGHVADQDPANKPYKTQKTYMTGRETESPQINLREELLRHRTEQVQILERGGTLLHGLHASIAVGPQCTHTYALSANVVPERVRKRNDGYNFTQNAE